VKIGIDSDEVQPNDIVIELVRGHDDLKLRAGFVEVSASIWRMHCTDGAGKKAAFLIIGSLEPHAVYTFEVSQLPSCKLSSSIPHTLYCAISSFSDEPAISREGSNKAHFNFVPPENLTVHGLALLLRRA
jgi:hypothetical protein